jgi:HEPN domain-containing protein
LLGDATFHCQQAVEKTIKAFLTWHDRAFRKTHDRVELGAQCADLDRTLDPILRRVAPLTEYAWRYRYPGEPFSPTPAEVHDALTRARDAVSAVLERLPAEVRP